MRFAGRAGRGSSRRCFPVLLIALCFGAAGEATGYATGRPGGTRLLCDIELHRTRYLKRSQRRRWQPTLGPA